MGKFAPRHPAGLRDAVNKAVWRGTNVPTIVRQLANGTLPGYPVKYELPLETARYYSKQAKRKQAAAQVTPLAAGDPSMAIDHLARQLLSEAELGVREVREAKQRDPEATKRWADVLKVLGPLLRPEPIDGGKTTKGKAKAPTDPLTARLSTAAKPTAPSPLALVEDATQEGSEATQHGPSHAPTHTDTKPGIGGVATQARFGGPKTRGEGAAVSGPWLPAV